MTKRSRLITDIVQATLAGGYYIKADKLELINNACDIADTLISKINTKDAEFFIISKKILLGIIKSGYSGSNEYICNSALEYAKVLKSLV